MSHTSPNQPAPRRSWAARHKILTGLGAIIVFIISIATSGGSDDTSKTSGDKVAASPAAEKPAAKEKPKKEKSKTVVFKVWGNAPAGALGGLDIGYGTDTDNRKGKFVNGKFTATLPFKSDTMYYQINAQLQGSGDIQCSVTVNGKTKKAHASGGYNLCTAQLSNALFGDWA